jgi:hypothetical protein
MLAGVYKQHFLVLFALLNTIMAAEYPCKKRLAGKPITASKGFLQSCVGVFAFAAARTIRHVYYHCFAMFVQRFYHMAENAQSPLLFWYTSPKRLYLSVSGHSSQSFCHLLSSTFPHLSNEKGGFATTVSTSSAHHL